MGSVVIVRSLAIKKNFSIDGMFDIYSYIYIIISTYYCVFVDLDWCDFFFVCFA